MKIDYLNLNDICLPCWFQVGVVLMALHSLIYLVFYIRGLYLSRRSQSPSPSPSPSPIKKKKRAKSKKKKAQNKTNTDVPVANISPPLLEDTKVSLLNVPRRFTYKSLVEATKNFHMEGRMSLDRLGQVFIGKIAVTNEVFAIRRNWPYSYLSVKEFVDEVLLLSRANHPNLAKLIGYAVEGQNRLLVYEYVSGGSLDYHLHENPKRLDWNTRMNIALGVARALEYLQNTMNPPILHCYIEPSNIWLDEVYTPKLSAFGVVRMYPARDRVTSSLMTFGSYNYALLDYRLSKNVTVQADVYGFGIFMLEIITGKKGIFPRGDGVTERLIDWVKPYLKDKQKLREMVDPMLEDKFDNGQLYEAYDIAAACLEKQPDSRPSIVNLVKRMNHLVTQDFDLSGRQSSHL